MVAPALPPWGSVRGATMNGGEPAVLFCFVRLVVATRDFGIWSDDRIVRDR